MPSNGLLFRTLKEHTFIHSQATFYEERKITMARGTVRKKGNNWYYAFDTGTVNGKRSRIERYGGKTKKQAEATLRQALQKYENDGAVVKLTNMNVQQYFMYWYENYVQSELKPNTQINYLNIINKYIIPKIGNFRIRSIGPAALQNLVNDLGETKLAKHTVQIIVMVIKEGFKKAVYPYQLIKEDPARYIIMPKYHDDERITRKKLKIITMNQYEQILSITPPSNPFYIPLQIAFGTGMRRGEVCGLTWANVDLNGHTVEVKQAMMQEPKGKFSIVTPKTTSSYRTISIGESLVDLLKQHKKHQIEERLRYGQYYHESNFVCTKENGSPVTPNTIKYQCDRIQKELGFPFNFHSLRHTHATMLLENGANIKDIQARLGHSRIATTMDTYSHVTHKMQKQTVNIFERIMKESKTDS